MKKLALIFLGALLINPSAKAATTSKNNGQQQAAPVKNVPQQGNASVQSYGASRSNRYYNSTRR